MKRKSQFFVKYLLLPCILITCIAVAKSEAKPHHTKAQQQYIALAKQLSKDFTQGNYKAVYSHFDDSITKKMSRSQFNSRMVPYCNSMKKRAASLTIDKQHSYLDTKYIYSAQADEPKTGKYTTISFVTFYKNTPIRKEVSFTWRNNNPKVVGFDYHLGLPKKK